MRRLRCRASFGWLVSTAGACVLLSSGAGAATPPPTALLLSARVATSPVANEPFHHLVRSTPPVARSVAAPSRSQAVSPAHLGRVTVPTAPTGFGLIENDWPAATAQYDTVTSLVHRTPQYMGWYFHWGGGWGAYGDALPFLTASVAAGATPVVTWMSDDPNHPSTTPYPLRQIASGAFDAYITSWANGLRSFGHAVILRFDPEMNGSWMAWSSGRDGQTQTDFISAWRHIHDVFTREGATNVRWMWSPNVEYSAATAFGSLYPGDAYVDWAALDGYNWGTIQGHSWQSFAQVFDASLMEMQEITARPLMIAEVGCAEAGGDKAAWIRDMFAQLAVRPAIRAFMWFDLNKETDWRINSSAAAATAFAAALAQVPLA